MLSRRDRVKTYSPAWLGDLAGGLTLSRRIGEGIIIGEGDTECVVIVEESAGGSVTLRLLAGPQVYILRAEIEEDEDEGPGNKGNR